MNFVIIGSPFLAFLTIALVCEPRFKSGEFLYNPQTPQWLIIGSMLLTHSHVMLVFLRSHMRGDIFKRHPYRFTLIPLLMFAAMWSSNLFLGIMAFVALYWDEWHSLMQTFGFGRIYDAKLGNDPSIGRKLDMGMCFVLGLLPHVLLLTFVPDDVRTRGLEEYMDLPTSVAEGYGHYFTALRFPLIAFGVGYILFYIASYRKLVKNGYTLSKTKIGLFLSTGISAGLIASFYSVADAAYFGNIYHALQYYFIVYVSEGSLISQKFGVKKDNKLGVAAIYCCVVLTIALLVAYARINTESISFLGIIWLLSSLVHFWYDGFIWSVRRQDI